MLLFLTIHLMIMWLNSLLTGRRFTIEIISFEWAHYLRLKSCDQIAQPPSLINDIQMQDTLTDMIHRLLQRWMLHSLFHFSNDYHPIINCWSVEFEAKTWSCVKNISNWRAAATCLHLSWAVYVVAEDFFICKQIWCNKPQLKHV